MLGTLQRLQFGTSTVSAYILVLGHYYATLLGVNWFGLQVKPFSGCLVAKDRCWYRWFCLLSRTLMTYCCCKYYYYDQYERNPSHWHILLCIRVFGCLIIAMVIMQLQFYHGKQVLCVINTFLRLFRKVQVLAGDQKMVFGNKRELGLLLVKSMSFMYEMHYTVATMLTEFDELNPFVILCKLYTIVNVGTIYHVCFIGYLSVGALYDGINGHVRQQLRDQLTELNQSNGKLNKRRHLKAAEIHLDVCLAVYEEIQRVSNTFLKLFELFLCLALLCGFANMAIACFYILANETQYLQYQLFVVKILLDLLLLTLAIHGAQSSSRVVRRLSLENYFICEQNEWHMKFEIFLSRLNYFDLRVRPLGLFEVSNELILVFISAMVTYLTYLLQYTLRSENST